MASSSSKLDEQEAPGDGGQGEYDEKVSNFAKITNDLEFALQTRAYNGLLKTLEPLKHDKVEVDHFREYVLQKKGMTVEAFARSLWDEEAAEAVSTMLNTSKDDDIQGNVKDNLIDAIEQGDSNRAFMAMNLVVDVNAVKAQYAEKHPGRDLYTDIIALSNDEFDLATTANNVFGKVQNYENVKVNNEEEAKEARLIIARIYEKYDIEINSQASLDKIRKRFPEAPPELLNEIKTSAWTLDELRDLEFTIKQIC